KKLITLISLSLVVALANAVNITVDDFHGLNTASGANDAAVTKTENGLTLTFGPGSSSLGRDAYGTGSSTFGQSGAWFDGSYLKFGNSGNQMQVDFRLTNNTGVDQKLTNLSFDVRSTAAAVNSVNLKYLATGDSALIKGASVAAGSEMANLAGLGTESLSSGINNVSESIGGNISGTAWIANGGYANIRLTISGTGAAQLDNFVATVVPEPSTYALLSGIFVMAWLGLRRRSVQ
ncbi:MAG: PEP-CTERM sorting domain-containing protein, partial [Verrucomicrobiota bacterium]|nr:PEP-CTERM sorting domain-containing protein [Verrucomicrobiota bacterium]